MECTKTHVYDKLFENLPQTKKHYTKILYQCAGCAYDAGYEDAMNEREHKVDLQKFDEIPKAMRSSQKIKDPINAYDMGYAVGEAERRNKKKKKKWWHWFANFWGFIVGKKKNK